MQYAVTSREMKLYDRNTSEHYGIDSSILMERASLLVADSIEDWKRDRRVDRAYSALVFAGVGNNGGDGVCTARILKLRGYKVTLCVIGGLEKASDLTLRQLDIAGRYGIKSVSFANLTEVSRAGDYDIIVDAIFGIGLSRPLSGTQLEAVNFINDSKKTRGEDLYVVSVDMPSGVNADNGAVMGTAVRADSTVTFNHVKLGQIMYPGCEYAGRLRVEDAGITSESFLGKEPETVFYDGLAKELLPERRRDSNKGTNGKVLIVAGSVQMSGAAVLSASACLKSGAGMVRVFTAAQNAEVVRALLPEVILDTYEDFEPVGEKLSNAMEWSTQAVIGPGIGTEGKGRELLTDMLERYDKSLVMDADALNLIAEDGRLFALAGNFAVGGKKLILTPHMGEFARLVKKSVRECKDNVFEETKMLAKKLHATVICKDARSIVGDSNEKKIYINVSGNDGMATAGSGDVLSGIAGALLNKEMSGFETAAAAAYIHGLAGDAAARAHGRYSMVASDIVSALSEVLE